MLLPIVLPAILLVACSGSERVTVPSSPNRPTVNRPSVEEIGARVPSKAASVKRIHPGHKVSAPMVVIEETHASRAGQAEVALILSAMHDGFALKNIVLEGYLKEDPSIADDSLPKLMGADTPVARARLMSDMLRSGDMSGAEFAKVVYPEMQLIPAEKSSEYSSDQNVDAMVALPLYLGQIALNSLDQSGQAKAERWAKDHHLLDGGTDKAQRFRDVLNFSDFVISLDPWSKQTWARFQDEVQVTSIEEEIAAIEGILARAKEREVKMPAEYDQIMSDYLSFLRKRGAASQTIVNVANDIAERPDSAIVAVNIGAGHTSMVSQLLDKSDVPYVLVSLNSLHDKKARGDMTMAELDRKYARLPVSSGPISDALIKAFPVAGAQARNKPKPVVQLEWFKAKTELYSTIDTVSSILEDVERGGDGGPPTPPRSDGSGLAAAVGNGGKGGNGKGGGGQFLASLAGDDHRFDRLADNSFVIVDRKKIEVLRDKNGRPIEVLFPAEINSGDPANRRTIWIKAKRVPGLDPDRSSKTVEEILETELDTLKQERERAPEVDEPATKHESIARLQVSVDVKAVVANTREEAVRAQIKY